MGKATGPGYRVSQRRRRKNLTNYPKRMGLIKSKLPRMVVRKSSRHIIVQFIEYGVHGDKTILSINSKELLKRGWPSRCNTPTAFLTGALAANKVLKKGIKKSVLDIGLQTPSKGAIVFAAARGAVAAGIDMPIGEGMIDELREKGTHIVDLAKALKGKPEYEARFSAYLKAGVDPENIVELFEKTKDSILRGEPSG
ncbi:MAG: 50S ribosomal protein L18 [Candidatus Micrarchaeota archaeon]